MAQYGVEIDFQNKTFARLLDAVGKKPGADFDSVAPFGGRRRCIMTDTGVVLAYYGDECYTEQGTLAQAVTKDGSVYEAGTAVQVMVEQPKFYYKIEPLKLEPISNGRGHVLKKARYYVSEKPGDGYKLHPAFKRNGRTKSKIYLSAYEGCAYNCSAKTYVADDGAFDSSKDQLSSVACVKPISGNGHTFTRAVGRKMAKNRGNGWTLATVQSVGATELLFLIEYAHFNTQGKISSGVTTKPNPEEFPWTEDAVNAAEPTGATASLGNTSGYVKNYNGFNVPSYRGEENFWGNIYKWVDGMNVKNPFPFSQGDVGEIFVADHSFTDDSSAAPYENVGISLPYHDWLYISAFGYSEKYDWMFIPVEHTGGSCEGPVGDRSEVFNGGWRVARVGGSWGSGTTENAGGFCWVYNSSSSLSDRTIGGRLLYISDAENTKETVQ